MLGTGGGDAGFELVAEGYEFGDLATMRCCSATLGSPSARLVSDFLSIALPSLVSVATQWVGRLPAFCRRGLFTQGNPQSQSFARHLE